MKIKQLFFAFLLLFTACNQPGKLTISGAISDADSATLYLEKTGLVKDSIIDSVKLNKTGEFKLRTSLPVYPDLFRLRVKNQQIILGIDSVKKIEVSASANSMNEAIIKNSLASEQIQKFRNSAIVLQKQFDALTAESNNAKASVLIDSFKVSLEKHKKEVRGLILNNPLSMASYFALFQQISGQFIFSPYEKEDRPYYQSVATAFYTHIPEYDRTKNIYNIVIEAIREDRMSRKQIDWEKLAQTQTLGFIDIDLKNSNGYPQKLSSFIGKPILLDFSAYSAEASVEHTFSLREIYKNFSEKGLLIYQVSLDRNQTYWANAISNIPWTCVFDPTGNSAQMYNVEQIPTMYLISKEGSIVGKYKDIKSLETDLPKIL